MPKFPPSYLLTDLRKQRLQSLSCLYYCYSFDPPGSRPLGEVFPDHHHRQLFESLWAEIISPGKVIYGQASFSVDYSVSFRAEPEL